MRLINKILTIALLFIITGIQAQSTSSPYSRFGYGLLNEPSLGFNQGLSNTGIALRPSNHLSFLNPASISAIDSSHFIFEVGLKNQFTTINDNSTHASTSNTNMEYLGVGFPITRWWGTGLTMLPFSKLGYAFYQTTTLPDGGTNDYYYNGSGGSNQVVWSNSFIPIKGLSIGIKTGLVFGQTTLNSIATLSESTAENTSEVQTIDMKGMYAQLGFQYEYKLTDKKSLILGATFQPKQKLKSKYAVVVGTDNGTAIVENISNSIIKSDLPMKIGSGLGFVLKDELQCGIDYTYQNWTNASIFGSSSDFYQKMQSLNVGLEYLPNKFAPKGYFKRVRYRFGARYLQTNLALPEPGTSTPLYSVNEKAASFGMGFPLKSLASNINISAEYGTRATKSSILPKETFFVINLNFTLNENWFYKHKIK
jgi:hypothetical protein